MPSLKAIFTTPEKAKHFADHFGIVGLRAKVVQEGKNVTVTTEDDKSFAFVKQMVKDIREDSLADKHISRFLISVRECVANDRPIDFDLLDNSAVKITSDFAKRFLVVYENLSDEARRNMTFIAIESRASHTKAFQFVMDR